jgi:hypothetical protein
MKESKKTQKIPSFLQSALWSYDLSKMEVKDKSDKRIIIEQVLNYGTWEQVKWVTKNYSRKEIKDIVKSPSRGIWMDDALNYWLTLLNMKMPRPKRERALFSLDPKFKI